MNTITDILIKSKLFSPLKEYFSISPGENISVSSFDSSAVQSDRRIPLTLFETMFHIHGESIDLTFTELTDLYLNESKIVKEKKDRKFLGHYFSYNRRRIEDYRLERSCLFLDCDQNLLIDENKEILKSMGFDFILINRIEKSKHHLIIPLVKSLDYTLETKAVYVAKLNLFISAMERLFSVTYDRAVTNLCSGESIPALNSESDYLEVMEWNRGRFLDFEKTIENLGFQKYLENFVVDQFTKREVKAAVDSTVKYEAPSISGVAVNPSIERARAYLSAVPGAVSGSAGHNTTYSVACTLAVDFDLDRASALMLLDEYNLKCIPQWSTEELDHKINSAFNKKAITPVSEIGAKNKTRADITANIYRSGLLSNKSFRSVSDLYLILVNNQWKDKNKAETTKLKQLLDSGYMCIVRNQESLADMLDLSGGQLNTLLRRLESFNLIQTVKDKQSKSSWTNNIYIIGKDGKLFIEHLVDAVFDNYYSNEITFEDAQKRTITENKWIERIQIPS